jgi:hypothetical protein
VTLRPCLAAGLPLSRRRSSLRQASLHRKCHPTAACLRGRKYPETTRSRMVATRIAEATGRRRNATLDHAAQANVQMLKSQSLRMSQSCESVRRSLGHGCKSRSSSYTVWRRSAATSSSRGLVRDLLHDGDGALADECGRSPGGSARRGATQRAAWEALKAM